MARTLTALVIVAGCAAPAARIETGTPSTAAITTTVTGQKAWVRCNPPGRPSPCQVETTTTLHPPPLGGVWLRLRTCESGDNYQIHNPPYAGAYQWDQRTWDAEQTGYARADLAPYWTQDAAAVKLHAERGWEPWPVCGPRAAAA